MRQHPPSMLRFGTVTATDAATRTAWVRFPGGADPHPVRCVESVPTVGGKVAVWSTSDRLYYTGGPAPVKGSGTTVAPGVLDVTFPPGRFTTAPVVVATLTAFAANAMVSVGNITTAGCRISTYNIATGNNIPALGVNWMAL